MFSLAVYVGSGVVERDGQGWTIHKQMGMVLFQYSLIYGP